MPFTAETLSQATFIGIALSTPFTATTTTVITSCTVSNVSAADASFALAIVPNGEAVTAENNVIPARVLSPDQVYACPEAGQQVLEAGDSIQVIADTASALTLRISGRVSG